MTFLNVALPLASALLSLVFAVMVFEQWRRRRRSFQLVWTVGLVWYGLSVATEAAGTAFGWNAALYRTWYLVGAFFVPAYLGAGTLYLLSKTRFGYFAAASLVLGGLFSVLATSRYPGSTGAGYTALAVAAVAGAAIAATTALRRELQGHVAMGFLLAGSLVVAALVVTAPLSGPFLDPSTHVPEASAIPGYLRVSSVPFNAGGGLSLVFGALYSAFIYMPKRRVVAARLGIVAVVANFFASLPTAARAFAARSLNSRVPATILIAAGALIPGVASGLDRFGVTWPLFAGQFLGVVLIFGGFLVSEDVFRNAGAAAALWPGRSTPLEG